LPSVTSAAGVFRAPMRGPIGVDGQIVIEGDDLSRDAPNRHPLVNAESATPGYFATMGIRLVAGREFTRADGADAPGVVMVSESLARALWPGRNPIGQRMLSRFRLKPDRRDDGTIDWDTVVGVAADVRYREIEQARFDLYLPLAQADAAVNDLVVRTTGDPASIAASVRALVQRRIPGGTPAIKPMTSMIAEATAVWRMTLVMLGAFAAFALLLSATGLYGLIAFFVEDRTRDIGIRLAVGATPSQVRGWLVAGMGRLVAVGLVLGLVAWLFARGLLGSLLFGVGPNDPIALGAAVLVIVGVAFAATYAPIRRAIRIDPVVALRE
jgi:hypothetical protein